jgi:glycogen phosphorylase
MRHSRTPTFGTKIKPSARSKKGKMMAISFFNQTIGPFLGRTTIAYLTMEIAIRSEMHTYSGGLGGLAGDTARSCADLDLPIVFVSLISRQGYLRQEITSDGAQIEHPDPWEPRDFATPLRAKVAILIANREVWLRPWLYVIESPLSHRVPVLLLDTDLDENHPDDRKITDRLYGGDSGYRLKQEIVLGVCGVRMLAALGFNIQTYHLNEGHAALLPLDLLRRFPRPMDQTKPGELQYDVGRVRENCIFTTHTPVEAGHDRFSYELVAELLGSYFDIEQFKLLAGEESLNMTLLALKLCGYVNGVALRHAETTQRMFPGYKIRAITNGIHPPTWIHPAFRELFNRHFPSWGHEPEILIQADQLPSAHIGQAHAAAKRDLLKLVERVGGKGFDPDKPIIGYARRMTAYKRPELLFSDLPRLRALAREYPFQIVMSGKAHPLDQPGKSHIRSIHRDVSELRDDIPIVFVPGYDLDIAKTLIPGVDIWLNTPIPPLEASGTSGMKAALNGVLNLSVLDGWWIEGCIEGVTGWSIGTDGTAGAAGASADDLYKKLETAVLPLYYKDRERWLWMMKTTISKIEPYFNTQRMMRRYTAEAYIR